MLLFIDFDLLGFIDLLPPGLFGLHRGWLVGLFGLFFGWGGCFAETGEHLVDFFLIGRRLFLDYLDHLSQIFLLPSLALLLDDQIREVALVNQVEVCFDLEAISLILLLQFLQSILDPPLFFQFLIFDLFIEVLEVRLLQSELCLQVWLNSMIYTL